MTSDDGIKCQLTYMKLLLGRNNVERKTQLRLNLIIGASDQFLEKDVVKANVSEPEFFKQPTKK